MDRPCSMHSMNEFQCPFSKKVFPFILRDNASRREALTQQQAHTGAEIQRLERQAGRRLDYRELLQSSQVEREQAAALARAAAMEAATKPTDREPFAEGVRGSCFTNAR